MEFTDRELSCIDCKAPFLFTAGEQEFYDRKGFKDTPKRCKTCRETRKHSRGADRGPQRDADGGAAPARKPRGSRPPGELFEAVCAACGGAARVPFRPTAGRPVYCRECFAKAQ